MSDDQFTKLFKYLERRFDQVDKTHADFRAQFDRIYQLLDEDLKRRWLVKFAVHPIGDSG